MLEKIIPVKYHKNIYQVKKSFLGFANKSYSQEGEDRVLKRYFEFKKDGFYVDVGAHHPKRFSNTYIFYKEGWRGINIDAMPGSMKLFKKVRPRDINLEEAIGTSKNEITYYAFEEPAINGFDQEISEKRIADGSKLLFKKGIIPKTLAEILDQNLPPQTQIDFLSIDVEGIDFMVLQSNNWEKYRPTFVLVETLGKNIEEVMNENIYVFMKNVNYSLVAKTANTCFYKSLS